MVSSRAVFIVSCLLLLSSFSQDKFNYIFRISTTQTAEDLPRDLTVEIINNESSPIRLDNLVFTFFIDDKGYWGTSDQARFVDRPLVVKSKSDFRLTIPFDSLVFTSFDKSAAVSLEKVKIRLKKSKTVRIDATISDMRILENPLASSSLVYSNRIDFK